MTAESLSYQLTPTMKVGIVLNPTFGKELKITAKGPEVLGNDEVDRLLACVLIAIRALGRKHHAAKFRSHIPTHVRLDSDVKMFMGRLERTLQEGKETVED